MIIGYKIKCRGLARPVIIKGETFNECMNKFKEHYEYDYDVYTDEILSVEMIELGFEFDIL